MNKIFTCLICLSCSFSSVKAQYVTIPDNNFRAYLMAEFPSCFNGANMMDTTCSDIVNLTYIDLELNDVADWTGFQYFDNLTGVSLMMGNCIPSFFPNSVTGIGVDHSQATGGFSSLPPNLTNLTIGSSPGIVSLPALPASLTTLDITNTGITSIPALPAGLQTLKCSSNGLTSLPVLPAQLKSLWCEYNNITSLPTLPSQLDVLRAKGNLSLTSFPAIPASLTWLDFANTGLTNVPVLPNGLKYFYMYSNNITTLPSHLPDSLKEFDCSSNQITVIPALPPGLQLLNMDNNQVSILPPLPGSLGYLGCSYNSLQALPALPPLLYNLRCGGNQISSIAALPANLDYIDCTGNQLSALPDLPPLLEYLNCAGNNITCMPVLPQTNLYITMDNTINCIPNAGSHYAITTQSGTYQWFQNPYPYCSVVNNSNHCAAFPVIAGYVYNDNNNNLVRDANEPYRANIKVQLSNGAYTFTNSNGYYAIATDSIGVYSATIVPPTFFTTVPLQYSYNFSSYDTLVSGDFPLEAVGIHDSLSISIGSLAAFARPGHSLPYAIHYVNDGTTLLNANIVVDYDNSLLTYDSSSVAGVINNGTNLRLAEPGFVSGAQNDFTAYFTVHTNAPISDTVVTKATIAANAITATDSAVNRVSASFDPNDKRATPKLSLPDIFNGDYIHYTIRFQNTGNDTAFNVVITDTLDNNLRAETLEMINASHPCKTTVKGNTVSFELLNLLLPDSNVNEIKSHGFVSFRVKPQPGVAVNSSIPNKAAIYFDYNSPVITNTAITQITNPVVLPLTLLSFAVTRQAGDLGLVTWSTANEFSVKQFNIEYSFDDKSFTTIAVANAKSQANNNYSRSITIPRNDVVYMRLKMIDIDGRFTYSQVVVLKMNGTNDHFSFDTNPVKDNLTIMLEDVTLINTTAKIINSQGAIVQTVSLKNNVETIDVRNLQAGMYVLKTEKGSRQFVIMR